MSNVVALRELPSPENPEEALATVVALRRVADQLERDAVDYAINQRWSWAQIAQALGVSRQAAHKKHARRQRQTSKESK